MRTFGNLSFYIPFAYTWHSRIRNVRTFIGWAGKYIIPLIILGIFLSNFSWILFSLGLIYTFCLYEMGYIENDCETIKTEYNPTLRLSIDELKFYV